MDHFDAHGCRAADHGIEIVRFAAVPSENQLDNLLTKRLNGQHLDETEIAQFSSAVQVWLGQQYHRLGWVMQLHIGAQRNNNTRMFKLLGADAGFDSIADKALHYRYLHCLMRWIKATNYRKPFFIV